MFSGGDVKERERGGWERVSIDCARDCDGDGLVVSCQRRSDKLAGVRVRGLDEALGLAVDEGGRMGVSA